MNYTEPHATPPQRALDPRPGRAYFIVVNAEGQHSIWPAALAVPAGWRQKGPPMRKEACLAAITAEWPDIAPVSVRAANLAGRGGDPAYVHEAFGERASRQPAAIAVVSAAGELTYRQLSESANHLAHHLQGLGVGPELLVGVGLERGAETIRCLLAVLAAGGADLPLDASRPPPLLAPVPGVGGWAAWRLRLPAPPLAGASLPLDPPLPAIRLAQMREEAGVAFVLTNSGHAPAVAGGGAPRVPVDEPAPG